MIKVEFENVSEKYDIKSINSVIQNDTGGVYFFYDNQQELIYIGRSVNLKKRLIDHVKGITHTVAFYKEFAYFRVLYTNNRVEQKIYELYAINSMKPKYNTLDVYETDDISVKVKSPDEIEKEQLADFVLNLLKTNKGISIDLYVVRQICENNNFKYANLTDSYVLKILKDNNVEFVDRKLSYKKRNR